MRSSTSKRKRRRRRDPHEITRHSYGGDRGRHVDVDRGSTAEGTLRDQAAGPRRRRSDRAANRQDAQGQDGGHDGPYPAEPSRFTVRATPHRTKSVTGWRCITPSKTSAVRKEISWRTRPRSSARRSSARSAVTPAAAPRSPVSIPSQLHGLHAGLVHVHVHAGTGDPHAGGLGRVPGGRLSSHDFTRSGPAAPGGRTASSC